MDKIKKWYQSIPLWLALFIIMVAALLIATFASNYTSKMASENISIIQNRYITGEIAEGSETDDVTIRWNVDFHYEDYSKEDMRSYHAYKFIQKYASFSGTLSALRRGDCFSILLNSKDLYPF